MIKKILPLFIFLSFFYSTSFSQDFLGLRTGNYSGITGVSLQPASIVDSRFKFDMNLFSTSVNYSNNYFLLDKNALLKFNTNDFSDYASFKDKYLSEASLPTGEKVFFNISNRTQLPLSFMATTGKNSGIALNMQFRTMVQGRGISQDFAKLAFNDFYYTPLTNTSVDVSGIRINSLSWAEVGLTYGRVLYSSGKHFLKGAVTGKYLAGLSSINLSSNDLQARVNSDSTFDFNSSNVNYSHNKSADFDKLFDKNFSPDANAFGLDAGLVYEYRGNIDKFTYLKSDDEKSYDALRRDVNKYIFKLGVSLLDVGMFRFDKPANVNSFSANINNWNLGNAHYNSIKDFDTALAKRVVANLNDPRSYNVYLPTALSAQLDLKFVKGLFLNVMSYWPLDLGNDVGTRFDKFGYYTITPRFETRHFGLYIPYTVTQRNEFTDYKQHLLGATVRLGPLFIGSSNLGSVLFNNKLRAADVHVGLKIGFTYGKPNKSNRFLNTVFKEKKAVKMNSVPQSQEEYEKEKMDDREMKKRRMTDSLSARNSNESRLILDYKNGKVYNNPDVKQNVTIINNYYYGNSPVHEKSDTITVQNNYRKYYLDSLNSERQEIARLQNQRTADSASKITSDSLKLKRQQLDSLIRSMQQLQKQMDSTSNTGIIKATDSSIASNRLKTDIRQDNNGSFKNRLDSSQMQRGEALMANADSFRLDSARANLPARNDQVFTDKKKDETVTESFAKQNNSRIMNPPGNVAKDSSLVINNQETIKKQDLKAMQDSIDFMSKRYSDLTDSLTANSLAQKRTNNEVVVPVERNVVAPDRTRLIQNKPDPKEYQRMQDRQNDLYNQYANQANSLSKDIDRLNNRLVQDRRNDRRNNNYIPIPIPINNSRDSKNQTTVVTKTDTVYIRDSIIPRDSIRIIDTVNNLLPDSVISRPLQVESVIDTIFVKEPAAQPSFDYASLPEENILFSLGKWTVQPIYDKRLNFMADVLKKNSGMQVHITGHTDATGSRAINEKLSLQRAEAVSNYLIEKGVSQKQIRVTSESFENPAVTGNTKSARSQNRRVALKLEKMN